MCREAGNTVLSYTAGDVPCMLKDEFSSRALFGFNFNIRYSLTYSLLRVTG